MEVKIVKSHKFSDGSVLELAQNDNGFDVSHYSPDGEDWDRYGFATRARAEEIYESCICGDPQLMQNYVETYLDEEVWQQEINANKEK